MARPHINLTDLIHDSDPGTDSNGHGSEAIGATEKTYERNQFDPRTDPPGISSHDDAPSNPEPWQSDKDSDPYLTYTSARKLKMVPNSYNTKDSDYSVFCYVGDWAQYDDRYEDFCEVVGGRGFDYTRLGTLPYNKIVMGFLGHVGFDDLGDMPEKVSEAGQHFGVRTKGSATFTDPDGDAGNYRNCGFKYWMAAPGSEYDQDNCQGLLGALRVIHNNEGKSLSFSLGGWSMSYAFSDICSSASLRNTLVESILTIKNKFPMFTHIDLDWEYPGSRGAGNPFKEGDGVYFATFIEELTAACEETSIDLGISIAVSANLDTLAAAQIDETAQRLNNCGVRFNLMSYDLFTIGAAGERGAIGHHTNLKKPSGNGSSEHSTEAAVEYLIECGVNKANIFIGFAGYTRNARNSTLTNVSPLSGNFDAQGQLTVGTFEHGVTELPDLLSNYLDLEGMLAVLKDTDDIIEANKAQFAATGFVLCTDTIADADFLHNPETGLFMSIETPRTVKAKAEYVKNNGLGGLFIWTGDQDNGLLANAAWEGLGLTPNEANINMEPYYQLRGVDSLEDYYAIGGFNELPSAGKYIPREAPYFKPYNFVDVTPMIAIYTISIEHSKEILCSKNTSGSGLPFEGRVFYNPQTDMITFTYDYDSLSAHMGYIQDPLGNKIFTDSSVDVAYQEGVWILGAHFKSAGGIMEHEMVSFKIALNGGTNE